MRYKLITTAAAVALIWGLRVLMPTRSASATRTCWARLKTRCHLATTIWFEYVNHLLSMSSPSTEYYRSFQNPDPPPIQPCASAADLDSGCDFYTRTSVNPAGDSGAVSLTNSLKDTLPNLAVPAGLYSLNREFEIPRLNAGAVVFYLGGVRADSSREEFGPLGRRQRQH